MDNNPCDVDFINIAEKRA